MRGVKKAGEWDLGSRVCWSFRRWVRSAGLDWITRVQWV